MNTDHLVDVAWGLRPIRSGTFPSSHPAQAYTTHLFLLKIFIYGYLNHIPSRRRLECESGRNVELIWLTGRLMPDHKTIAGLTRPAMPIFARRAES